MNELIDTLSTLGAASFSWLWMPLLAWSALALVVFGGLRLTRRHTHPLLQYRVRVVMLLALPLGIGLALLVSSVAGLLPSPDTTPALEVVVALQDQAAGRLADAIRIVPNDSEAKAPTAPLGAAFWLGLATLLAGVVALWRLHRLAHEALLLRRFKARLRYIESREVEQRAGMAAGAVGLRGTPIRYAVVDDAAVMPMTFGWRRPVVVLPAWLLDRQQDLHMVLLHELVHIRRRDYLGQWVERVVDALFAVHPLVRHLIKQINRYRELVCDAEVLMRARFEAHAYASLLYQMLRSGGRHTAHPALGMAEHHSTIKTRIHTMERQTYTAQRWHGARRVSIILSATVFLLSTVFVACSELAAEANLQTREVQEDARITINGGHLYVNGTEVSDQTFGITGPAQWPFYVITRQTGLFMLSLKPFADAQQAGWIAGNDLRFTLNNFEVNITSMTPILDGETAQLYVRHDPAYTRRKLTMTGRMATTPTFTVGTTKSIDYLYDAEGGPPPPPVETKRSGDEAYPFQVNRPVVRLNGETHDRFESAKTYMEGYIALYKPAFGRLVFSGVPFDDAEPIAHVVNNVIWVETEALRLTVTTENAILAQEISTLWFRHDPDYSPDLNGLPEHMREAMANGHISTADNVAQLPKRLNQE